MADSLKQRIQEDMKAAMRARDSARLGVIRMILAAIKQREVDARTTLDDAGVLAVLDKMLKQRRDALAQFRDAGRDDLVEKESFEVEVIQDYLPPPLDDEALDALIGEAVEATGAASPRDMGKVMGWLKPRIQGRADMGVVSARVKQRLG